MNKKLMYIFAIFIVAAITCISQPKKTTLRDKAMVNYAFDYLSSPGSLPLTTAATELSAIHGHSTSQYRLGEFYLHGSDGKPLDYTQARYWYEQSAEQEKIPRAHKSRAGWIYHQKARGRPMRKAILWYKEAAEQGYAHAQYTLGLIYRNGTGINVNHYESQKWLKLAAKQHYKNAERLLAGLPAH
ncbi:sel1 repeat family protein [Escherichia coli]|nr:sel1 repeat family protein [Escherichia coli]